MEHALVAPLSWQVAAYEENRTGLRHVVVSTPAEFYFRLNSHTRIKIKNNKYKNENIFQAEAERIMEFIGLDYFGN